MARRVNTKFLTILTIVVVGGGVLLLLANRFLVHESPEKYISAGNQFMTDGKYDEAVKAYRMAVGLNQRDPSLWVAYGDALNKLSSTDIDYVAHARKAWDQALVIDPNNKPALDRMMQFWSDVSNFSGGNPDVFTQLEQTARKLFAADPTDARSEIAIQTSVIRPWLSGVEKPELTIRATIDKLVELMKKYPDNPDLPLFAAQGKLRLAERNRQRDQRADADKLVKEADSIISDATSRSKTAAMFFTAAQVAQLQELLARDDTSLDQKTRDQKVADWRKRRQEFYTQARALAKPDDPLYTQINISAARASADKHEEAEKILRDLLAQEPDDQQVRLALAEQLAGDPTRRKEAIEILEKPFASNKFVGPRAALIREWQVRTLVTATNLRLEQFAGSTPQDREKLLPKIREELALIEAKDGVDSARSLRLRGKLLRLQGETIQAIQTLEKARAIAEKRAAEVESQGDRLDRWEITDLLARAYIDTAQTGRAKQLLTEITTQFPNYTAGRKLLAEVLVKEGSLEDAKPHIQYLKEHLPNDPEVIKLQLQLMDPKGTAALGAKPDQQADQQHLREVYSKLPEETKGQILDKATAAMAIENQDDAVRLVNKAQSQMPGDYDVARMGLRIFKYMGELDKGRAFVDVAVKANPKDDKLQVLAKQAADMTPENILKTIEDEVKNNPDPVARDLGLASIARQRNQPEQELKLLQDAQRLRPNDTNITALTFKCYLRQQKFDKAEMLLEPLSAANQDQAGGLLFRYQLAMVRGDYPKALDYGRQLVQKMGEFGQSWLAYAQALQANNQIEEAIAKYSTALEKQSDSVDALRGIIQCYYAANRPSDAKRYIDRARRAAPYNPDFKEMEISYELTFGDPEKAIPAREEAATKGADKPNNILALGQAYMQAARSRAAKAFDPNKTPTEMFNKAKAAFKQGITKWPDEIAFYAYYAEAGARSGDVGDSEQLLKQLAARDAWKDKVEPKALLAEFYAVGHRYADAEQMFRQILAKDPANTDMQVRLANLLTSQKKTDDALKVLEANAQDPKVARRRVEVLIAANRGDEADKVISDALDKSPSNLDLLHLGASVDIDHGRFDRAEKRLARALEINADDPTTHYYLGDLRRKQPKPDLDTAMTELTKGKASPTMGTEAKFALADCMKRKGDPDGALRELEGALASQPTNMTVRLGVVDAYLNSQPPRWVDAERVINDAKALPGYVPNPDLLMREVSMLNARNEPDKALVAMQQAHQLAPDDKGIAHRYIELLLGQRKFPKVNDEVEALVSKDATLWWAYELRAESRRGQGNREDSIKDFESAMAAANAQHNDDAVDVIVQRMGDVIGADDVIARIRKTAETNPRYKLMIARLQAIKGDTDSSLKTLEQVLAVKEQMLPTDRDSALRFGAMLYLAAHQMDKSTACYEELLKASPNDVVSLNNMACLLAESVQPPRPHDGLPYAERAYKLMQASGTKEPTIMDTYAWLLVLNDRVDEGIDLLRTVNEIRKFPDAHYHLGKAYLKKQFGEQAMQELELANDLVKQDIQQKNPPDKALIEMQQKIEAAMGEAGLIIRTKKSTANAPTATNVP